MKKKTTTIKPGVFKYLLFLPLLLLSFCQSEPEEPLGSTENKLTIDAKVLSLMKSAIQSDSDQILTQNKSSLSKGTVTEDDSQCTNFLYPMTFQVYSGDDPIPETKEINSDEELIAFIEAFTFENKAGVFTPNYEMFIYFPIILLDTDGYETVLNNLEELEGTLEMAVEACENFSDGSGDGSGGGSGDGSGGGSGDGSGDDSGDGSEGESSDGSGDGSGDDSGDGSGDDSGGGSGDDSGDGSDDDNFADVKESNHDTEYKFCDKNSKKVYICHKGKTICVSVNAIWGHMEHHEEDLMGTCED